MEGGHTNLPVEVTSFIGRERQIDDVQRLLESTRLLTLTGAGGCGKTRLALRVAMGAVTVYADGVWLVELAALADAALVPQAVAMAVGARQGVGETATESLARHLLSKKVLVVLDNCEHVVGEAARLADALLSRCPGVRILATSREPLGSAGEVTWRVPGLTLPPPTPARETREPREPPERLDPPEQLWEYEATRLFVERARAALPGFEATLENADAIGEICRRLDGIPLAIELAAARVRAFSAEQLAARLDDRFRVLTAGPRTALPQHQTLRAAVEWSHALLSEPERALLRRLAVFAGGWSLEAAEAVASGGGIQQHAVLDLLAQLVDKSLVIAGRERGVVRYRLLETMRQYARERLAEAGEEARTRDRHLAHFLALAEETEPRLRGSDAVAHLDGLEREHDNLRAALEWGLSRSGEGGEAALRLGGALAWFWWSRGYHSEGRRWLTRALSAPGGPDRLGGAARMKALHGAGWLAHHQQDGAEARARLSESLSIARELGDRWWVAWALHALGRVAYFEKDPPSVRALAEESLAEAEAVGDAWLTAWPLHLLGIAAYLEGDYATARGYYERSLALRRALGYQEGEGILLSLLALVAVREGELTRAHELYRQALTTLRDVAGGWSTGNTLAGFAGLAAVRGEAARAVRLAGACAAHRDAWETPVIPLIGAVLDEGLARARDVLGEAGYAAAWREGEALSLEEAVEEAMKDGSARVEGTRASAGLHMDGVAVALTPTEAEVLRRLAGGRTTKEIAAELVIAVSTVDRHITHIYEKLGVRNRTEATSFAVRHGLV